MNHFINNFTSWKGHTLIALAVRIYLGVIFVIASLHKIAHPALFALDIATYDILPLSLVNIMAITLPYIEITAGVLMITGIKSRAASWLITLMMMLFTVAILMALGKGIDMSCGCFASSSIAGDDAISISTVLRDSFWLMLSIYVLFFDTHPAGISMLLKKQQLKRSNSNV